MSFNVIIVSVGGAHNVLCLGLQPVILNDDFFFFLWCDFSHTNKYMKEHHIDFIWLLSFCVRVKYKGIV